MSAARNSGQGVSSPSRFAAATTAALLNQRLHFSAIASRARCSMSAAAGSMTTILGVARGLVIQEISRELIARSRKP
ncbi:MAG TPA: hypothetical protein VFA66_00055 [Gaiellaceae bacterium]|nr:hypothetical protein [Gaiellaceae bacterium]